MHTTEKEPPREGEQQSPSIVFIKPIIRGQGPFGWANPSSQQRKKMVAVQQYLAGAAMPRQRKRPRGTSSNVH